VILKATTLLVLMLFGSCTAQTPNESSLIDTKKLLERFHRETISAVMTAPKDSIVREIERLKPTAELRTLYDRHDPSVLILGSFWAEVCQAVGADMCVPRLIRDLRDSDARVKAFACENLEILKPPSAVAPLTDALKDKQAVPGYLGNPDVAVFAAQALAAFGYADGIDSMLAHAEREGRDWYLTYERTFQQISGQKLPRDLKLWRRWFQEHRKGLKYAP